MWAWPASTGGMQDRTANMDLLWMNREMGDENVGELFNYSSDHHV
jgi:hypothetical protein